MSPTDLPSAACAMLANALFKAANFASPPRRNSPARCAASMSEIPSATANSVSFATATLPSPRFGVLTMRKNAVSASGLSNKVK